MSASVSATVTALEATYTDADAFEPFVRFVGDELDDACTRELVHHIRGTAQIHPTNMPFLVPSLHPSQAPAAPYLGSLPRLGIETARSSLEAEHGATVLSSHWNDIMKPCGTRMCCD